MTKLRNIAVMAALALATSAQAQGQDGSWNTKYGLLFDLQNIFQNGSVSAVGPYGGTGVGVGAQMNLSGTRAIRAYANLSRFSDPQYESKTNGTVTQVLPDPTSVYHVKLGAAALMRMTTATISPYVGAGASVAYDRSARKGDYGTATLTSVDNSTTTYGLGVDGRLGLEWRVHKALALFAEYLLDVSLYSRTSVDNSTTTGVTTTTTSSTRSKFLNFDTGIGQAGQIGVLAFF